MSKARDPQAIYASFDSAQREAHRVLRAALWAMYPTEQTLACSANDDELSNQSATLLIDALLQFGIELSNAHPDRNLHPSS